MKSFTYKIVILTIMLLALLTGVAAVQYTDVTLTTFSDVRVWGGEELLPMVIKNNAPYPQEYMLQIDPSVGEWGTFRFEPSAYFTLAPGESHQTYILLKADNNDFIGLQKFDLTVLSSNGDQRTIKMSANLIKPVEDKRIWPLILAFFIIVLIGIFIIVVAIVLIRKVTKPKQDIDSFDDFDDFDDFEDEPEKKEEDEFNEFDDFDDFDIFDEAESDKVENKGEEFY